jgi:hypothetical protein
MVRAAASAAAADAEMKKEAVASASSLPDAHVLKQIKTKQTRTVRHIPATIKCRAREIALVGKRRGQRRKET